MLGKVDEMVKLGPGGMDWAQALMPLLVLSCYNSVQSCAVLEAFLVRLVLK